MAILHVTTQQIAQLARCCITYIRWLKTTLHPPAGAEFIKGGGGSQFLSAPGMGLSAFFSSSVKCVDFMVKWFMVNRVRSTVIVWMVIWVRATPSGRSQVEIWSQL